MRVVLSHVGIRNIGFNSFYKKFDLTFDNIDTNLTLTTAVRLARRAGAP